MHNVMAHREQDGVGVAIRDITAGEEVVCVYLKGDSVERFRALDDVPLGHKVALRAVVRGEKVIEYGELIGVATRQIQQGNHVHVQNLKSARWSLSTR